METRAAGSLHPPRHQTRERSTLLWFSTVCLPVAVMTMVAVAQVLVVVTVPSTSLPEGGLTTATTPCLLESHMDTQARLPDYHDQQPQQERPACPMWTRSRGRRKLRSVIISQPASQLVSLSVYLSACLDERNTRCAFAVHTGANMISSCQVASLPFPGPVCLFDWARSPAAVDPHCVRTLCAVAADCIRGLRVVPTPSLA